MNNIDTTINLFGYTVNYESYDEYGKITIFGNANGVTLEITAHCEYADQDTVVEYWEELIADISDYGIGTLAEVSFHVAGSLMYDQDIIKGKRIAITKTLREMYRALLFALYHYKQGNVLLYCTAFDGDKQADYRKAIYRKLGFELWQDESDVNTHVLYQLI